MLLILLLSALGVAVIAWDFLEPRDYGKSKSPSSIGAVDPGPGRGDQLSPVAELELLEGERVTRGAMDVDQGALQTSSGSAECRVFSSTGLELLGLRTRSKSVKPEWVHGIGRGVLLTVERSQLLDEVGAPGHQWTAVAVGDIELEPDALVLFESNGDVPILRRMRVGGNRVHTEAGQLVLRENVTFGKVRQGVAVAINTKELRRSLGAHYKLGVAVEFASGWSGHGALAVTGGARAIVTLPSAVGGAAPAGQLVATAVGGPTDEDAGWEWFLSSMEGVSGFQQAMGSEHIEGGWGYLNLSARAMGQVQKRQSDGPDVVFDNLVLGRPYGLFVKTSSGDSFGRALFLFNGDVVEVDVRKYGNICMQISTVKGGTLREAEVRWVVWPGGPDCTEDSSWGDHGGRGVTGRDGGMVIPYIGSISLHPDDCMPSGQAKVRLQVDGYRAAIIEVSVGGGGFPHTVVLSRANPDMVVNVGVLNGASWPKTGYLELLKGDGVQEKHEVYCSYWAEEGVLVVEFASEATVDMDECHQALFAMWGQTDWWAAQTVNGSWEMDADADYEMSVKWAIPMGPGETIEATLLHGGLRSPVQVWDSGDNGHSQELKVRLPANGCTLEVALKGVGGAVQAVRIFSLEPGYNAIEF